MASSDQTDKPITIKKYANRRLYNTASSSYVTLETLCQMVKDGADFVVYDAKTGDDITRSVLTQIIVEEESKGQNMLPISFLRQLISLYGDNLQFMVPRYLEFTMQAFARNQDQMRQQFMGQMGQMPGMFALQTFEEMSRQNMQMFQRALSMFSPFGGPGGVPGTGPAAGGGPGIGGPGGGDPAMASLKSQLDELESQLRTMGAMGPPAGPAAAAPHAETEPAAARGGRKPRTTRGTTE